MGQPDDTSGRSESIATKFEEAIAFHRSGRIDAAERLYRQILEAAPRHAPSLRLLAVIEHGKGDYAAALRIIDACIAVQPDFAEAFYSRGLILKDMGRLEEALANYERAIALDPAHAEAHNNRGNLLLALDRPAEAVGSYDAAIHLKPDYALAHGNRGNALKEMGRFEEALASYDAAIAIKPDSAGTLSNRAGVLLKLDRLEEALEEYDRAIAIDPNLAEAHSNRGNLFLEMGRYEDAALSCGRAVALKPNYADGHKNLGNAFRELKRIEDALLSYDRAIALKPDDAEAHKLRGMCRLLAGQFKSGWQDYEWRWSTKEFIAYRPRIEAAPWRGEELAGRSILVYAEQGAGDILQFSRYLPRLAQRGAIVTFVVAPHMARVLKTLGPEVHIVGRIEEAGWLDFHCPLMSLPLHFGTEESSIPAEVPYLEAEPELAKRWKETIGDKGLKIGIAWHGKQTFRIDKNRWVPLNEFVPLARLPRVRLISLQKNFGLEQYAHLPEGVKVEDLGEELDGGADAFVDTAAVISCLDLVIGCDTSVAHLAGALGKPTWVVLKRVPDWRWLLDRETSPWYPSMRLFRQASAGDWTSVFERVEQALRALLGTS